MSGSAPSGTALLTLHIGTRLGTIEAMQEDLRIGLLWSLPVAALVVFTRGMAAGAAGAQAGGRLDLGGGTDRGGSPPGAVAGAGGKDEIARLTVVLNASFDRLQKAYEAAAPVFGRCFAPTENAGYGDAGRAGDRCGRPIT